jgi:hypothetical protein
LIHHNSALASNVAVALLANIVTEAPAVKPLAAPMFKRKPLGLDTVNEIEVGVTLFPTVSLAKYVFAAVLLIVGVALIGESKPLKP